MKVVGIGAGGHASVVLDAIQCAGEHEVIGLLDRPDDPIGRMVLGVRVIGNDDQLATIGATGVGGFFMGVGSIADPSARRRLYEMGTAAGLVAIRVIHPRAIVAGSATIGAGTVVLAGAVVNANATIGDNAIVNTAAIIEHDCVIGDHTHVAPGAQLGGAVRVGDGAHIGIGATVLQGIQIGAGAIVGGGAVVTRNVAAGAKVVGVPARVLGNNAEQG